MTPPVAVLALAAAVLLAAPRPGSDRLHSLTLRPIRAVREER